MDARILLEKLCQVHGVSMEYGQRFLPLIERAMQAPGDVRERILQLVRNSLDRQSAREAETKLTGHPGEAVLLLVARILHQWQPPQWLLSWEERRSQSSEGPDKASS